VVYALRVVEDEPVHEETVEPIEIVEQQRIVKIDELILDGAVGPLDVSIHLRGVHIPKEPL